MLNLALVLFIVAIVAALSGLGSIASSAGIAQVLFFFFLALFLASLIEGLRGHSEADRADPDSARGAGEQENPNLSLR